MIRIGKIVATHGLQGAVILKHITGSSNWLKNGHVLFVEIRKGSRIPYFTAQSKAANNEEYIATLEELDTVEEAKKLIGKDVYVQDDILVAQAVDSPLLWIGFNLVDKEKGGLGPITDVMQAGAQWLAAIQYEGKEVLIPLVEQFIIEVNIKNKYLRMDLPEGLLDI